METFKKLPITLESVVEEEEKALCFLIIMFLKDRIMCVKKWNYATNAFYLKCLLDKASYQSTYILRFIQIISHLHFAYSYIMQVDYGTILRNLI